MGKFYEFVGRDAVVAIQILNLNGMGLGSPEEGYEGDAAASLNDSQSIPPPRAGLPAVCARTETARLCRAGMDVVMCEQASFAQSNGKLLTRYVAQICTPHSPFYVWGDEAGEPTGQADAHLTIWGACFLCYFVFRLKENVFGIF